MTNDKLKEMWKEASKRYRENHPSRAKENVKRWRNNNPVLCKERSKIYNKRFRGKPLGRAVFLVNGYKTADKNANRGECTLTAEWIVENIFTKSCVHCGKEGWEVIGCNRLDNNKPHTKDNVEPCCEDCNLKLNGLYMKEKLGQAIDQISATDGEVINTWLSIREADKNGFTRACIMRACNGKQKQHKGYIWKRHM